MSSSKIDELFAAISALPPDDRRALFARLGVLPAPDRAGQPALLGDFAANTLDGPADYVVVFDGGSEGNPGRGYGSYALLRGDRREVKRLTFGDDMTNNEAEYATLMHALDDVQGRIERGHRLPEEFSIELRGDSALVMKQISGEWRAKDDRMRQLRDATRRSIARFKANRLALQPRKESVRLLGH